MNIKTIILFSIAYIFFIGSIMFIANFYPGNYSNQPKLEEYREPHTLTIEYDYTSEVVGSGSMMPYIKRDSLLYLKKINNSTRLEIDDMVSYKRGNDNIIHSIYYIYECNNETIYLMKGIANEYIDEPPVRREQMMDVVVGILPKSLGEKI